jgi:ligand-binding SRPBCC domain-containing protein
MNTYERSVRVAAPLSEVWEFHSTERGLEELTPDWMGLCIEDVRSPDNEADPEVLEAGSRLRCSVRPLGVGPQQHWTSEIVERETTDGGAYFRDVMHDGPFEEWEHTHSFYPDGEWTLCRDRVRYQLPLGALGHALGPVAVVGFEPMFRFRHRRTRELLGNAVEV